MAEVFVSQNALAATGVAFTDITRHLPGRGVTRIEFDPNDPTRLYAVLGGYAGGPQIHQRILHAVRPLQRTER